MLTSLFSVLLCSPIEDGAALGALLGKLESKAQIPAVLQKYEHIRRMRVLGIREETFRHQEEFHLPDGTQQQSRDKQLAKSLEVQAKNGYW